MGYTHYWKFKAIKRGEAAKVERAYQRAVKLCNVVVQYYSNQYGGLSGYSAHTTGQYGGILFNGSRENAHEDFVLREHFKQNDGFSFCKTAQKPYDAVVVACLIVLKNVLKDNINVSSDGNAVDWIAGQNLARAALAGKKVALDIPPTIERVARLKMVREG